MSTYIMIYGLLILLGACLIGTGVVLLFKNFPYKITKFSNFRKPASRRSSPLKEANEQIQEMLRDFEEKWRNPQK